MIIDEGFIENAKKIAETQPQQSEVKVPEIRRENFGYHITISRFIADNNKIRRIINSLDIFKEISELDFGTDEDGYGICEFDADLFITIDNIRMLYSGFQSYTPNCRIKDNETGKVKSVRLTTLNFSNDFIIYQKNEISVIDKRFMLREVSELCTFFGINKDNINFTRWMIRNEICVIETIENDRRNIFPVYSEGNLMDIITGYRTDMTIWKDIRNINIDNDTKLCENTDESLKAIAESSIDRQKKFMLYVIKSRYYGKPRYYINVYPMMPVKYFGDGLTYVRITLKIDGKMNPGQIELWADIFRKSLKKHIDADHTSEIDYKANII